MAPLNICLVLEEEGRGTRTELGDSSLVGVIYVLDTRVLNKSIIGSERPYTPCRTSRPPQAGTSYNVALGPRRLQGTESVRETPS